MTSDEMMEHDEMFRAESEANRERKANGDDKPAKTPRRKAKDDDRYLTHKETAVLYLFRAIEIMAEQAPKDKLERLIAWFEQPDTMEFTSDLLSALMIAEGIGIAERQGGVQ